MENIGFASYLINTEMSRAESRTIENKILTVNIFMPIVNLKDLDPRQVHG